MKRILALSAALTLGLTLLLGASGSGSRRTVTVVLNGQAVDTDTPAYIDNDRTMVPLRAIAQALGLWVEWDSASSTAYLYDEAHRPALENRLVVLDPGHGGSATGAVYGGVKESELNLAIARRTARLLEEAGITVLMTREADEDVSLYARTALANRAGADVLVSIHCNASVTNPSAAGIYTACQGDSRESLRLATVLRLEMMRSTAAGDMGTEARPELAVLRTAAMPAALVECGFMSTPAELRLLQDEAYQEQLARGIVQGILAWLAG